MNDQIADRIRGTILCAACANSLGGTCLGMNRKEIMFAVGIRGVRNYTAALPKSLIPDLVPGSLLSDTLLAQQLAQSLIVNKGSLDAEDLKERFARLLASEEFLKAAPGAHCLLPLRRLADGADDGEFAEADSTHVNAASRSYPAGCLPPTADIVNIATAQARLSHADSRVWAAAAVIAHSVSSFVGGARLDSGEEVRNYVMTAYEVAARIDARFAESWDDVAPDLDYTSPADDLPYSLINVDSHVNEAVPTAAGIFLIFRHDLEEAVCAAASAGGDTDSVAAIVGALSGAYHGASAIPERWLKPLSHREDLEAVADGLIRLWS